MEVLTIEIDTPEDKQLLLALLPKLNGRVVMSSQKMDERKRNFVAIARELAQLGTAEKFGDPSEWQRETRQDRPLAGREE